MRRKMTKLKTGKSLKIKTSLTFNLSYLKVITKVMKKLSKTMSKQSQAKLKQSQMMKSSKNFNRKTKPVMERPTMLRNYVIMIRRMQLLSKCFHQTLCLNSTNKTIRTVWIITIIIRRIRRMPKETSWIHKRVMRSLMLKLKARKSSWNFVCCLRFRVFPLIKVFLLFIFHTSGLDILKSYYF